MASSDRSDSLSFREAAHHTWNAVWKGARSDAEALFRWLDLLYAGPNAHMADLNDVLSIVSSGKWVDGACRTLLPATPQFFAAMAATDVSANAYVDIRLPWPAFALVLPKGLMVDESGLGYEMAYISQLKGIPFHRAPQLNGGADGDRTTLAYDGLTTSGYCDVGVMSIMRSDGTALQAWTTLGLADLLFNTREDRQLTSPLHLEMSDVDGRIQESVRRAAVGLLYTMQHSSNWRNGTQPSRLKSDPRFGPPDHRVVIVGSPSSTTVDVRHAIRDYIAEGKSAPSVQSLVRGHHKRQVIGVGRGGRKIIWVEPYWRGPEDAPILARPYKVGAADHVSQS